MADERLIDTQWVDILPPLAPAPVPLWIWLAVAALCLGVAGVAWWHWQHQPRQRALRQLRACARQLQRAGAASKPIAMQIYHAMQMGMQVTPTQTLHARDADWQDYYRRLTQCVFQAHEPDAGQLHALLHETRAWLRRGGLCRSRRWPRTAALGVTE